MIYQPTPEQIRQVLDQPRQRWPQLAGRIDAAQQLLLSGALTYCPRSSSGFAAQLYAWFYGCYQRVDERIGCHCPLHATLPDATAPLLMGRLYCEHLIAYYALKRIAQQLLADQLSAGALAVDGTSSLYSPHHQPLPLVIVIPTSDPQLRYTFVSPDDFGRFAYWLGRQQRQAGTTHLAA